MKNVLTTIFMLSIHTAFSQNVVLIKVAKTEDNTDKFFYKITPENNTAEYLGELEVQGFSKDDAEVFGKVYKKAKEIGANAYSFHPFEEVDGSPKTFDPSNYKLNLYYIKKENLPQENNTVYIIGAPNKDQKIAYNSQNILIPSRSYTKKVLDSDQIYTLSTKKFLGTSIKLAAKENQPVQYFQISGTKINSNPYGQAGINLKSGDITMLEKSYGEFLTTIYQKIP